MYITDLEPYFTITKLCVATWHKIQHASRTGQDCTLPVMGANMPWVF